MGELRQELPTAKPLNGLGFGWIFDSSINQSKLAMESDSEVEIVSNFDTDQSNPRLSSEQIKELIAERNKALAEARKARERSRELLAKTREIQSSFVLNVYPKGISHSFLEWLQVAFWGETVSSQRMRKKYAKALFSLSAQAASLSSDSDALYARADQIEVSLSAYRHSLKHADIH